MQAFNGQRQETLTARCKDPPMPRQNLNDLVGRFCNRTAPFKRPAVLPQYLLGNYLLSGLPTTKCSCQGSVLILVQED